MDKSIVQVYLRFMSRCGLCYVYIPAEEIDVKPGEKFLSNYKNKAGNSWFIRIYVSGRKSGKKQRPVLTKWIMMNREITYYNEMIKLEEQEIKELIPEKIPFFAIHHVIKKRMFVPNSIIYGGSWYV